MGRFLPLSTSEVPESEKQKLGTIESNLDANKNKLLKSEVTKRAK